MHINMYIIYNPQIGSLSLGQDHCVLEALNVTIHNDPTVPFSVGSPIDTLTFLRMGSRKYGIIRTTRHDCAMGHSKSHSY